MSTGGDAAALFAQAMQAAQGDALRGVEARIDARIREIAAQIESTTKPEDIAASVGEAIEALRCELPAIVAAHAGVDALKLADAARAALLAEIGLPGSKVGALASGDADLLPALRSPDPAYVQTETGRAIRYGLAKGARFIIVSGPSGSGKTFPAEQELRALGRRYLKLSGGDGLTRGDLIGRQEAANGATHWRAGTYPQALRHGLAVIHDEIDRTDGLVLAGLNAALDREPSLLCPWGETIDAAPGYVVIATCNSLTDETGLYVAQRMSADLPNRALLVHADYLPAAQEIDIIHRTVPGSNGHAEAAVRGLEALRAIYLKGQLPAAPSTRTGILFAECATGREADDNGPEPTEALEALPARASWDLAYLNALPGSQRRLAVQALSSAGVL
jgi:MoxR-like ATPase